MDFNTNKGTASTQAPYQAFGHYRPFVTDWQMRELRRLGFRGPVGYLYEWEAAAEIRALRRRAGQQRGRRW